MAVLKYDPKELEPAVLAFWKKNKTYPTLKQKNKGKQTFYFLQGPPYTSGRLHVGHAWNNSLKDMALRYKRMRGYDVFDRAGYDMHGLPTEQKVVDLHKLKGKEGIEKFGLAKFSEECMKWCLEKAQLMNEDLWRMGVWMDFENAYMPVKNTFMENEWWLVKTAWEKQRLYLGKRTLSWCATHETALAKHETEYKKITDKSIYVKLKVEDTPNEYLIVWTTTPWTLALNLAVMVNPSLNYVRMRVDNEIWIVAEALMESVLKITKKEGVVIDTVPGKKLKGIAYAHPWLQSMNALADLKNDNDKVHTVILSSEYVDTSAGTGLVHCAPGCGPEDYEVGHREGLPPLNTVLENGTFDNNSGLFAGLRAKLDDEKFVERLQDVGALLAQQKYPHDYAHCERCHNPVIFRATSQWFFKVEDMKDEMVAANEKINWVPEAGKNSFRNWLENLRDNSVTKQRYWGTPFPLWECEECEHIEVIGSIAELKKKASTPVPENLHKPWIDDVKLKCTKCKKTMHRHPDVLDVWIDAGTTSWNALDYPLKSENLKLFPPDFILEAKEQVRGWFNVLMISSYIALGKPAFKNVYMHGMLTDVNGEKMSKSLGNVISPYEIIDKYGVDTMRYYLIGAPNAGVDINYDEKEIDTRYKHLGVLWNVHNFLIDLCGTNEFTLKDLTATKASKANGLEERYILSRLNSTLKEVTHLLDQYRLDEVPDLVMDLMLLLSRTYIQLIRDKAAVGTDEEKLSVASTIYAVLLGSIKMFSVVTPFITEQIYLNLKEHFGLKEESIHHLAWDIANEKQIDTALELHMDIAGEIIAGALAAREKAQLSVRWPVSTVTVVSTEGKVKDACTMMESLIKNQVNCKSLVVMPAMKDVKVTLKADAGKIGATFGPKTPKIIAKIAQGSEKAFYDQLTKDQKIVLKLDKEEVTLLAEHVQLEHHVPAHLKSSAFKSGLVYVDTTLTDELEAEGFSREVMRRIQSFRKECGLEKKDTVHLFVKADDDTVKMLNAWKSSISEKVGASQLMISSQDPAKKHTWHVKDKVKGDAFELFMSKA